MAGQRPNRGLASGSHSTPIRNWTRPQRQLALRLPARGLSLGKIGPQVCCSHQGVALLVRLAPTGAEGRLGAQAGSSTLADREEITPGGYAGVNRPGFVGGFRKRRTDSTRSCGSRFPWVRRAR